MADGTNANSFHNSRLVTKVQTWDAFLKNVERKLTFNEILASSLLPAKIPSAMLS